MSQQLERVYTINLGKVKLSQSQHRAVRAINMIKEFARHHMKVEQIKIEEELAHQIWARGVRRPPRKIRLLKKTRQASPVPAWIILKTKRSVRTNPKRRAWRSTDVEVG